MRPSIRINYFYFGFLFAILSLLSISNMVTHEHLGASQLFYLFYSLGEVFLEVLLFLILSWLILRYLPRFVFSLFIGITFLCFAAHLIDFFLVRIVHYTIFEMVSLILRGETWDSFFHMLAASGLPMWVWILFFVLFGSIPIVGIFFYRWTDCFIHKKLLAIPMNLLVQVFFCAFAALFLWDYSASCILPREAHVSFIKSLPWKITFLNPTTPQIPLSNPLARPETEEELNDKVRHFSYSSGNRPNVYLIIAETIRDDIIVPEIAPNLSQFREKNIHGTLNLANSNATQISWFSIFHSNFPYYWKTGEKHKGSPALQILRKLGYNIHVYTSADLEYYKMDELLFGEQHALASFYHYFPHEYPEKAWKSDRETVAAFERDLQKHPEYRSGQCFIFFWDSSHFDYSWPKEFSTFAPTANSINFFKAIPSQRDVSSIKNGYKNAVHYIDHLFGQLHSLIPDKRRAIIGFTSDHGEEFFEQGHLFHTSQLSNVQIQIPLIFHLPKKPVTTAHLVTHMDIFPTFIDAITHIDGSTLNILEGQSLFLADRWPFAVIARYRVSHTPCELCIHNGDHKLIVQFENHQNIFQSKFLQVLSLRTAQDRLFYEYQENPTQWINTQFIGAFDRLFPPPRD